MDTQLFEGELTRLAPPDPDRDAEIESKWTHDAEYMRLSSAETKFLWASCARNGKEIKCETSNVIGVAFGGKDTSL